MHLQEDRIRQHATADSVFEYFANYKVISESGPEMNSSN